MISERTIEYYRQVRTGIIYRANKYARLNLIMGTGDLLLAAVYMLDLMVIEGWLRWMYATCALLMIACGLTALHNSMSQFRRRNAAIAMDRSARAIEDRTAMTSYTALQHHSDQFLAAFNELVK